MSRKRDRRKAHERRAMLREKVTCKVCGFKDVRRNMFEIDGKAVCPVHRAESRAIRIPVPDMVE